MKRSGPPRRRTPLKRYTPLARHSGPCTWRPTFAAKRLFVATPPWADHAAIREVFIEARELAELTDQPHEVDHVIPLIHADVCGLHVAANLRAVPSWFNREKGNRFDADTFEGP